MRRPGFGRAPIVEARARIDAGRLVDERDAAFDGANERAEIAADAFGVVDDEAPLPVHMGEDRLVRRVLADDVAPSALDAEILVDFGLDDEIEIEVLPVGDRGDGAAAESSIVA